MELVPLLQRVRSIDDLPALFAALGHEPLHDEVATGLAGGTALAVARTGDFPWFAIASPDPERQARRVARRLADRGRIAGVLALDAAARRLALAVTFDGVPSLELELDRPCGAGIAALGRLRAVDGGGALAYAARAADALSGEAVGRRFFREFRATLDRMADGLPATARREERRSLALLQLTRVLFLYFIQAKGWLAGRDRFLAEEVDRCLAARRGIHRDLLRPLFFGTLNRPASERRGGAAAFGDIPFLNGGLFEPHPLERALRRDIPNPLWRDAFDRLFERFHFTVSEGGGRGGVAPDMLGRVFEGVMAPDVRRASGTFYTPAALVRRLLAAALGAAVAARLRCGDAEAERRLADRDPAARAALEGLTVLDPAAGSGAFLLGALDLLSAHAAPDGVPTARIRRRILERSLFGVDLSSAAVRLTELRLWLAVIADDREERPERVAPLPNLDCLIRQGDSLFEPGFTRRAAPDPRLAASIARLRHGLVSATGGAKRELVRELRAAESRAAAGALEAAAAALRTELAGRLREARTPDLFGGRRGLDRELRAALVAGRAELRALRTASRELAREREVPWFQYGSQFADVFAAGGFGLVAGNPPWLRAEEIPAETRRRLPDRYRWWRRAGAGFGNRPDLAVAFMERALELAAPGGVVALLVPAKVATAGYGAAARHGLAASTTLLRVADLTGRPDAAFDATVYPLALVARKAPAPGGHRVRLALAGARPAVPQTALAGGGPWILSANRLRSVAARLARDHPALGERVACHLGVKTGANRLFLDPPPEIEPELVRWAVRGRDLRPFRAHARVRLLWTHGADGAPLARLPPAASAYIASHEAALRARADFGGGPPWTMFRTGAAVAPHRLVWSDLARRLVAAALSGKRDARAMPLNTCYVAAVPSAEEAERLAAWLNSRWIGVVAGLGAVPAAGGFHRFSAAIVSRLPLPPTAVGDAELPALARAGRRGDNVQEALDECVARHLGLSPGERAALGAADRR